MIRFAEREYLSSEIEKVLEWPVLEWFKSKYKDFTPPQKYAIMEIHNGKNVLISSPTGSGKTLSAFLAIINKLVKLSISDELEDKVYCIYVSPLKALNNDIERNLLEPLKEIEDIIRKKDKHFKEIRVAVKTGDTTIKTRSNLTKRPPHILITTPESLAISLNAPKFSDKLSNVNYVIVDEIHAIADNKRGSHLSLTLERLAARCKGDFVRIGLSATVHPLEEVAKFLVGEGRDCIIVDVNYLKATKIDVLSPIEDLIYTPAEEAQEKLYKLIDKIISAHKTTLIFTNTRSATERVVHHLKTFFKEKYNTNIEAHHSSLSREHRLSTEQKLKNGELKVVVSSTSLELGIDIGSIDVVILLGSPKSVARALQRIGRSGHRLHEVSKGVIIILDRDDLIENIVLAKCARDKKFDSIKIYRNALDVLTQHLHGMALERKWKVEEAYNVVRKSYPFSTLSFSDFVSILKYLSGYYSLLEEQNIYGKIWFDNDEFGKRGKKGRAIYYLNIGTIPDEPKIHVFVEGKRYIGEVEEEFAERLIVGDVFVLGGKTYEFVEGVGNRIYVKVAASKKPTIPPWFSETLPLSYELAQEIEKFRANALNYGIEELASIYKIDKKTAQAALLYLKEQRKYSILPKEDEFLVEEWKDDDGLLNYIFHTVCGRKANDALARVFAYEIGKRINSNVGTIISDYGFVLRLPRGKYITRKMIEEILWLDNFEESLQKAVENTELLKRRFKNVASRSYLILRRYPGREIPAHRQRINSEILLNIIKESLPDFPLLKEAYREVFNDAMHIDEAKNYLEKLRKRKLIIESPLTPSPFSFNLLSLGATDVVMIDDRREFIKKLHERLIREHEKGKINERN